MKQKILVRAVALGALMVAGMAEAENAAGTVMPELPDAKPGECYARVLIPAEFRTSQDRMVVKEASQRIEVIPAKYEWVEEEVRVKDAAYHIEVVPAEFGTESERYEVSAAQTFWTVGRTAREASPAILQAAMQMGVSNDATPGSCFVERHVPAQFRTVTQEILKKEASEQLVAEPPKYEWAEEKVLVKEASSQVVEVPAEYDTVIEEVLVEPAKQVWKKGRGPKERIDDSTGEILCLIEVPAQYKKVTKRVLKTPASTKTLDIPAVYKTQRVRRLVNEPEVKSVSIPAEYGTISRKEKVSDDVYHWYPDSSKDVEGTKTGNILCMSEKPAEYRTVTRTVVKTPASTRRVEVPAAYEKLRVRKLVEPAVERRIDVPEEYREIERREKISDERLEWRRIICDTNMTTDLIRKLQVALKNDGYNPGPIDGVLGRETLTAIGEFQRKKGLPRGGLTVSTVEALGVQI